MCLDALLFVYVITVIMPSFSQIINIPIVPGKVIIPHKSISCPNGAQSHAESQGKKIYKPIINLVYLATLPSLI